MSEMIITKLTAENVKRIKAISIQPDGSPLVRITGKNGAGKSSILDSIAMLLGGKDQVCERPIRDGERKAKIVGHVGDLVVTRTFTAKGTELTVAASNGAKYPSPQAVLDELTGSLSFDPLAFSRMPAKQQAATLRELVAIDFTTIDSDRARAFDERSDANRQVKQLTGQLAGMTPHGGVPAAPVTAADVLAEIEAAQKASDLIRAKKDQCDRLATSAGDIQKRIKSVGDQIDALCAQQAELEHQLDQTMAAKNAADAEWVILEEPDLEKPKQKLREIESINTRVRENLRRAEVDKQLKDAEARTESLTEQIQSLDEQKAGALAAAKFPVPGLSFDESGVLLNGLPFAQASGAEQLRTSVAIGFASNPKLKVLLVRDGSLLDADGLKLLAEMAAEKNGQVWLESVTNGEAVGIVIEDGCVAGA